MSRRLFFIFAPCLLLLLMATGLFVGSVPIGFEEVWKALSGGDCAPTAQYIIIESRMPSVITAALAGMALGVGGLLMQTVLANPLAEPGVLGVSAGASLGAALAILLPGAGISGALSAGGTLLTMLLAFIGSMLVIAILTVCSATLRSSIRVLIAGVMISYLVGSATTLLSFYATDYGVQSFAFWNMGDFGMLAFNRLPWFAVAVTIGLLPVLFLSKPLDALLLGHDYAASLGFNVRTVRTLMLVLCGWLTAVVTAFCGPVAFIGLAAPHIARFILRRSSHSTLIPATILVGALLTLCTSTLCHIPSSVALPVNAVTPFIGVPVVMFLIMRGKHVGN